MKKIAFLLALIVNCTLMSCGSATVSGTYSGTWKSLGLDTTTGDGEVIIKPTGSEVSVQVSSTVFPTATIDQVSVNMHKGGYYEFQKLGYPGAYVEGSFISPDYLQLSYIDTTYDIGFYFEGYRH